MLHGKQKLSFPCLLFLAPSLPKQDASDDTDCANSKCRRKKRKLKAKAAQAPREFAGHVTKCSFEASTTWFDDNAAESQYSNGGRHAFSHLCHNIIEINRIKFRVLQC
ncbi:unnamed protein product [Ixodes pacificus]